MRVLISWKVNTLAMLRNLTSVARRGRSCGLLKNTVLSDTISCASARERRSNIAPCHRLHSASADNKSNDSNNETIFQKRYVTVQTCYDIWIDIPKAGLFFEVEYYDSCPDTSIDPKVPLVVALHDFPGTAEDLLPVLNLLAKLGYRVIAPNFPDCGKTKWLKWRDWNVFTGALDEKMRFVFDFQQALDIRRVDLVLGYGMGCSTCVALAGTSSNIYRSTALLCPAEHVALKPAKGKLRFDNASLLSTLWETLQTRPFLWLYMIFKKASYGYSGYSARQVINAARAMAGSEYKLLQGFMVRLPSQGVPCCMVYHSVEDAKVPPETSQKYAKLLGIMPSDFKVYREDKKTDNEGQGKSPRGLKIEHETPVLLDTYSKPIAKMIHNLMKTLRFPPNK